MSSNDNKTDFYIVPEKLFYSMLNSVFNNRVRHEDNCKCFECETYAEACKFETNEHLMRRFGYRRDW